MKRSDLKRIRTISDKVLMSLIHEAKDYRVCIEEKLYFFVKSNGNKSWQLRYKNNNGKWSWKGLGAFPEVNLHQVRTLADDWLSAYAKNHTCSSSKARSEKFMLINLMDSWLNVSKGKWGKKYNQSVINAVKKHVYPVFGERDFRGITAKEWSIFFLDLIENNLMSVREKLYGYVNSAYRWAAIEYQFQANPLPAINEFLPKYKRGEYKHIDISELDQFLKDIRAYPIQDVSIGLELVLLLFPRHVEIRQAKWEQFNLEKKYWIKPKEIMKNRKAHKVYLSDQAVALLKRLKAIQKPSVYLFPQCGEMHKPMSEDRFATALEKMGYKGRMTVHGVRYLASTTLNNAFSGKWQVIEATLSHKKGGVKGVYDKADHFEESVEIMQWWADYVNNPNIKRKNKTKICKGYGIYTVPVVYKLPSHSISRL